jgi:hypothetical protein
MHQPKHSVISIVYCAHHSAILPLRTALVKYTAYLLLEALLHYGSYYRLLQEPFIVTVKYLRC